MCMSAESAAAETLCFSPVKKKRGDIASERPWWKPFNFRIQVDDGPFIKPEKDSSASYEFNSERPMVRLRVISSLGKSTQRHSCALTVDMSISGFAAIMPSAVSSG